MLLDLCEITTIKKLTFAYFGNIDLEVLAKKVVNLEQIYMGEANENNVLPFVRWCKKLKTIKIDMMCGYGLRGDHAWDLFSLNEKRKKNCWCATTFNVFTSRRLF